MTNLEFYKDQVVETFKGELICDQIDGINDSGKDCCSCPFYTDDVRSYCNYRKIIDWLLEEHKEPIQLKQWEKDLIRTNNMSHDREFRSFNAYQSMKVIGYFKGITDTSVTLKEILDNCEVVDD